MHLALRSAGPGAGSGSDQRVRRTPLDRSSGPGRRQRLGTMEYFTINVRNAPAGSTAADTTLLLLPTLASAQAGPPMEEVYLVRDEVANMAWGVEKTVPLVSGISRPGSEVAKQTFNYLQGLIPGGGAPPPMAAAVRYQAMNSVPENWIPLIPGARAQQQPRNPIAARSHATHSYRRYQSSAKGAAVDFAAAPGPRPHPGTDLFPPRRRSAACWSAGDAVLLMLALDARPGLHLVARAKANRTGRGVKRTSVRSAGRQRREGRLEHFSFSCNRIYLSTNATPVVGSTLISPPFLCLLGAGSLLASKGRNSSAVSS